MTWTPLLIAAGAVLGALSRYALTTWWARRGGVFPWGTLIVNGSGAFLAGLLSVPLGQWGMASVLGQAVVAFVGVGFLGAYTTFSSYILETAQLRQRGLALAMGYGVGSPVLGLGTALAGRWVGQWLEHGLVGPVP